MNDVWGVIISFVQDISTYHNIRQLCRSLSNLDRRVLRRIANSVPGVISKYPLYNNFYLNDICTSSEFIELQPYAKLSGQNESKFEIKHYGDAVRRMYMTGDLGDVVITIAGNPICGSMGSQLKLVDGRYDLDFWFNDINKSIPMRSLVRGQTYLEALGKNLRLWVEYLYDKSRKSRDKSYEPVRFDEFTNIERDTWEERFRCIRSNLIPRIPKRGWITKITLRFDKEVSNVKLFHCRNGYNRNELTPILIQEFDRADYIFHLPCVVAKKFRAVYFKCDWEGYEPPIVITIVEYLKEIIMDSGSCVEIIY